MSKTKQVTPEDIFNTLSRQDFFDWYEVRFADHIQDSDNCPSREDILHDIEQLFLR